MTPPPEPDPSEEPTVDGTEETDQGSNQGDQASPVAELNSKASVISREEGAPVPAGVGRALSGPLKLFI